MGASSSGLLDEAKITHIKAVRRSVYMHEEDKTFVPY